MRQFTEIEQEKALTYLRYALADLEGLLDAPDDMDTRDVAQDTVHVIRTFLDFINTESCVGV